VLFLSVIGAATVLSWLVTGRGALGQPFRLPPIAAAVVVSVFVLGLVRMAMSRVGTPVGDIIDVSNRVADGDYAARLNENGPRPVRTVARAFNSMTTRLQAQDAQRRHLMADIAHELRNPLAVLQGRLEGMLDGVYPRDEAQIAAVLEETRMLARLVDDLRTLAHAESGMLTLQKESTDLSILIHEAVASFSMESAAGQVSISATAAPDLPLVEIDPLRIREVLTNLLSNALRHTPPGGTVSVTAVRRDDAIDVSVSDSGSGIAAEEVPKIFDRFYKGRSSRGSGLGLTIARNLVVAHGGGIRAESSAGRGTTVVFTLPVLSARAPFVPGRV
jgi:two-component system OmpR family sensor kinase/two-component system sensor histidine kinase BaeS